MRYFCFSYMQYYPCGGMDDWLMTDNYTEAKLWLVEQSTDYGYAYIYDTQTGEKTYKEDLCVLTQS
jgi:hypothetical protein